MTRLALSIPEAAAAAGVTPDILRRAINRGDLKAKRQSRNADGDGTGKFLIRTDALEAWLDSLPDA